jgi:sugar lactone lactonase YvrE
MTMGEKNSALEFRADRTIAGKGSGSHQFRESLRGIALGDAGILFAVGDTAVKVFDPDGRVLRRWETARPGMCVAVGTGGRVWVGQDGQVEIFDAEGKLLDTWTDPDRLGLVTAIGFVGSDVFLADANARWIRRYDRNGVFRNNIGDQHRKGGFHIPNGVVDFAVDGDGVLHVANPGMHRVERYKGNGEYLGYFGRFDGVDPVGFPGCCNPTNVAVDDAGRVIVTEKAGPRTKIYSPEGELLSVVADDLFDPAAKNMDVVVDPAGRIYVADTERLEIRVFEPGRATG